ITELSVSIILGLIGLFAIPFVLGYYVGRVLGVRFYSFRKDLPDLDSFLGKAKDKGEICILGIELDNLAMHKIESIEHALKRGIRFKIVGIDPDATELIRFIDKTFKVSKTKERAEAA